MSWSDDENYYMEREWRTIGKVDFEPAEIAKVVLPESFAERFRRQVSSIEGFECLQHKLHCPDV